MILLINNKWIKVQNRIKSRVRTVTGNVFFKFDKHMHISEEICSSFRGLLCSLDKVNNFRCLGGVAVGCGTCDRKVVGSTPNRVATQNHVVTTWMGDCSRQVNHLGI